MSGAAAANADGVHLRHFFSDGKQRGHRSEWSAHVVLIEAGSDDTNAGIGELHADIDDAGIEELHLVDAHDLHADLHPRQKLGAAGNGTGFQSAVVARNDVIAGKTIVDDRLEDLHALSCDESAAEAPDE